MKNSEYEKYSLNFEYEKLLQKQNDPINNAKRSHCRSVVKTTVRPFMTAVMTPSTEALHCSYYSVYAFASISVMNLSLRTQARLREASVLTREAGT